MSGSEIMDTRRASVEEQDTTSAPTAEPVEFGEVSRQPAPAASPESDDQQPSRRNLLLGLGGAGLAVAGYVAGNYGSDGRYKDGYIRGLKERPVNPLESATNAEARGWLRALGINQELRANNGNVEGLTIIAAEAEFYYDGGTRSEKWGNLVLLGDKPVPVTDENGQFLPYGDKDLVAGFLQFDVWDDPFILPQRVNGRQLKPTSQNEVITVPAPQTALYFYAVTGRLRGRNLLGYLTQEGSGAFAPLQLANRTDSA